MLSLKTQVQKIFSFCLAENIQQINLIIPFKLSAEDLVFLDGIEKAGSYNIRIASISLEEDRVHLPYNFGAIFFLGSYLSISKNLFWQAICRGHFGIYCVQSEKIIPYPLHKYLLQAFHYCLYRLRTQNNGKLKNFILSRASKNPYIFGIMKKIYHSVSGSMGSQTFHNSETSIEDFSNLLKNIARKSENNNFVSHRVVMVNGSLGAGGAERQIVNTLIGLKEQPIESAILLCEYLDTVPGLDFYVPHLNAHNIKVSSFQSKIKLNQKTFSELDSDIGLFLSYFPYHIAEEILNAYFELKTIRPEVVHAWQDGSSIKSGIAAIMAGVPKIILSARNVAPFHFAYHQPYMQIAYKALAAIPHVKMINNSEAGALDYANWLNLPIDRFEVIRNGVSLEYLKNLTVDEIQEYRECLGIPSGAQIVGSIFRFYSEKRPFLWIETAIKLAERNPNYCFLIVGDGPLKKEMQSLIHNSPYQSRFFLIGNKSDIKSALSLMDVFLLCSLFEGTPNVVLEAQWMGVPVVAMDAGGTAEAVSEGITGRIATNPDPEYLANLVDELLQNPSSCMTVKEEGPKFVKDRFSLEAMVESTMKLYGF